MRATCCGDSRPKVAVVVAQGEITDGEQPQGTVGGDSTSALLRRRARTTTSRPLVLRVDSPGGGVFPSEQIRREVELTKEAGKPVVVSMGNVAASGGYWISMNADRIYADAVHHHRLDRHLRPVDERPARAREDRRAHRRRRHHAAGRCLRPDPRTGSRTRAC